MPRPRWSASNTATIGTGDRGLAVQGERPGAQLGCHRGDRGIVIGRTALSSSGGRHGWGYKGRVSINESR